MTSEQSKLSEVEQSTDHREPYILQRQGVTKPSSWEFYTLGDLLELEYGKSLPKKERDDGPYPVFGSNGRSGWHSEHHIEAPGIIVGRKGVNLGVNWTNKDFNVIDTAYYINSDSVEVSSLDLRFLYYNLLDFDLGRLKSGSAVPGLNRNDFYEETVVLPPYSEQKKIATLLSNIDRKINLNTTISDSLAEVARTLFEYWFVEFGSYSEFKKTKLGKIPESFEVGTLGELMEKKTEGVDPEKMSTSTSYISLKHMPEESLILDGWDHAGDISSRKYQFKRGDLLFGKLRPYFCKVGPAPVDGVCSTDIVVINPNRGEHWKEFLTFQLSSSSFIDYCDKVSTGTRMPRVGWKDMCEYDIAIPPEADINQFHELIRPILDMIVSNVHQSKNLRRVRDTLLPKLMSGEVRVNDIELDDLEVDSEV